MTLVILGSLFLIGLVADVLGRLTPLPRVTLLLLSGVAVGTSGFDLIPQTFVSDWFATLTQVALAMVGFLLGQQLTIPALKEQGRTVLLLVLGKALGAAIVVAVALTLVGVDPPLALLFAGIATATAPAATLDVVKEAETSSDFSKVLLAIVALDDALGLIMFSLLAAAAGVMIGISENGTLIDGMLEVLGSVGLGVLLGLPMAYLTGRIRKGTPIQAEAFGFVLICAGGAALLDLSPILVAMIMGSTVGTLATHHERPFQAIEMMEWPFMILFFILTGASLDIDPQAAITVLLIVYIAARAVGTSAGVFAANTALRLNPRMGAWLGPALLPQAGVALGMALIASQRFPMYADVILSTIILSTVILEVASPVITRAVLKRMESVDIPLGNNAERPATVLDQSE